MSRELQTINQQNKLALWAGWIKACCSSGRNVKDWCKENNFGLNFNHKKLYKCVSAVTYAKKQGVKIAVWTVDNPLYKDIMVLFGAEIITTNKIKPVK